MNTETRPTPKSPNAIWNYFAFTNENIEEMKEKEHFREVEVAAKMYQKRKAVNEKRMRKSQRRSEG